LSTTFQRFVEKVHATKSGDQWKARCSSHEDDNASLSITEGDDGRVLLHCFAGCTADEICGSLGMTTADLFEPSPTPTPTTTKKSRRPFKLARWLLA